MLWLRNIQRHSMLLVDRLPIAPQDTTASLHDKLASLGGRLIVEALELAA